MRKVWFSFIAIAVLVVVMAIPAMAATPGCGNSVNWSYSCGPAKTQPTVPSIPKNSAPVAPNDNTGSNELCSNWNINDISKQVQSQFGNCFQGLTGNSNCPTSVSNCNQ